MLPSTNPAACRGLVAPKMQKGSFPSNRTVFKSELALRYKEGWDTYIEPVTFR